MNVMFFDTIFIKLGLTAKAQSTQRIESCLLAFNIQFSFSLVGRTGKRV
jgi:hypothetical protein